MVDRQAINNASQPPRVAPQARLCGRMNRQGLENILGPWRRRAQKVWRAVSLRAGKRSSYRAFDS